MFHNESAFDPFQGEIALPLVRGAVFYDGMEDACYALPVREECGQKFVRIELAPCASCVIIDRDSSDLPVYEMLSEKLSACDANTRLEGSWSYALATEKQFPRTTDAGVMEKLGPVSDFLPKFSGHVFYEKAFDLPDKPQRAYLEFSEVHECLELYVNNVRIGDALSMPYVFEVTEALAEGTNRIRAIVTSNPDRDQANYPEHPFKLDYHVTEPVGLGGEVRLYRKTR